MPYSVAHLLENRGNVLTVHKTDKITAALEAMIEHDFGQLPVVDDENHLLGMITYEGIARAARNFNAKPEMLLVRDAIVNAPTHYLEDNLFDLLDELKEANAVVIIATDRTPIRIVTGYDAAEFLRGRTEDLMHIEDIEFILKELIRKSYTDANGQLDVEKLQSAVTKSGELKTEPAASKKARTFDDLTLGGYINLLMQDDIWNFCAPILDFEKGSLYTLLEKIRQTRNDLAHFRKEISASERDELKFCAGWLGSRYRDFETQQGHILPRESFIENLYAVKEGPAGYQAGRSRYTALADWLRNRTEERFALTFEQIEQIIGSTLPRSALQHRAWWANDRTGHTHSISWLEAGWQVVSVDLSEKQVMFARIVSSK